MSSTFEYLPYNNFDAQWHAFERMTSPVAAPPPPAPPPGVAVAVSPQPQVVVSAAAPQVSSVAQPLPPPQPQQQQIVPFAVRARTTTTVPAAAAMYPVPESQIETFMNRMRNKRRDFVKLVVLALVVVLALSTHSFIKHCISRYVSMHTWVTDGWETCIRCAYPVTVGLAIWTLKAHMSK